MFGAAMGTIAGLLIAPRAGRETRQLIKNLRMRCLNLRKIYPPVSNFRQIASRSRLCETGMEPWDDSKKRSPLDWKQLSANIKS